MFARQCRRRKEIMHSINNNGKGNSKGRITLRRGRHE
jgi:hypothetical protein